ncbi:MAG: aldehyde dehydrogenase family protein, partial [Planctomycetota bacterium]
DLTVEDKYTRERIARVPLAAPSAIEEAIEAAERAFRLTRKLPTWKRVEILEQCAERLKERHAELAETLCCEAGKPIRDCRVEVDRTIETFLVAAREASHLGGEVLPFDASPRAEGVTGYWKRMPLGPCSFISPFNFPLNLVAHKIAPAIAAGCPFLLKPASLTPLGALQIGEILAETDWPAEAFSILPCRREAADLFTTDERLKLLSFTGSADVGWKLKARAGKKRVVLELGGNAAVIVDETLRASGGDLDDAIHRISHGAFYQSGQSCISVQRALVHHSIYEEFRERLVAHASELRCGDPKQEDTALGPIISDAEAARIESWVQEAVRGGARVLTGGERSGRKIGATVMENVSRDALLCREEVFGPVVILSSFHEFGDDASRMIGLCSACEGDAHEENGIPTSVLRNGDNAAPSEAGVSPASLRGSIR